MVFLWKSLFEQSFQVAGADSFGFSERGEKLFRSWSWSWRELGRHERAVDDALVYIVPMHANHGQIADSVMVLVGCESVFR
jgi:hypothetical protein